MSTQKKLLAFAILLAFILSLSVTAESNAENKRRTTKKNLTWMSISGIVEEIISDDPQSDYLLIKNDADANKSVWVAILKKDQFKEGDTLICEEGVVFTNYRGESVKRNFPKIVFTECSQLTK